jgi:hypothetical protein
LSRLPAFETYFTDADPDGAPAPVTGLTGATTRAGVLLSWDLPPEARWRRWEVYEGTAADFVPVTPILTTTVTVVAIPRDPGSGPWYYKVRALNTRDEASTDVQAGPFSVALIGEANLAANCVTAAKIRAGEITAAKLDVTDVQAAVVTAEAVNALEINAGAIKAGTIDAARLDVASILASEITAANITGGSIEGVSITGQTITGGTFRTKSTGNRIVLSGGASDRISFYAGSFDTPAEVSISTWEIGGGKGGYALDLAGPSVTADEDPYGVSIAQAYKTVADAIVPDYTDVTITATNLAVSALAHFYDRVDCDSSVRCAGRFLPTTDYSKTTDLTGVFIQDSYTKGNRWRVVFNSSTKQMALINGSTIYRATFA